MELDDLLLKVGLGTEAEDCSIVPISDTHYLISNIDIVTPIHDDPYIMGKIAACNATNDLFALNAVDVISFNCFLGLPVDIPEHVSVKILKGVKDFVESIDGTLTGGHTIQNDAPLMGGATSSIVKREQMITKQGVRKGDHLILTKPLGVQAIMAADRTMKADPSYLKGFDITEIKRGIEMAEKVMTTSNRAISKLIHKENQFEAVHAMTDVTGFGFTRHLEEMLVNSKCGVFLRELPAIHYSVMLEDLFCYGIEEGRSSEIAGAMLMSVDHDHYEEFTHLLSSEKIWWREVGKASEGVNGIQKTEDFHISNVEKYW